MKFFFVLFLLLVSFSCNHEKERKSKGTWLSNAFRKEFDALITDDFCLNNLIPVTDEIYDKYQKVGEEWTLGDVNNKLISIVRVENGRKVVEYRNDVICVESRNGQSYVTRAERRVIYGYPKEEDQKLMEAGIVYYGEGGNGIIITVRIENPLANNSFKN